MVKLVVRSVSRWRWERGANTTRLAIEHLREQVLAQEADPHALVQNNGFLPITDKSDPEVIYHRFHISKKAFKKAIGDLYRQRKITLEDSGIRIAE